MSNEPNLEHIQDEPDLRRADKSYIVNINTKKYEEARKRFKNLHRIDNIEDFIQILQEQMEIVIERLDDMDEEIIDIKQRLDILEP